MITETAATLGRIVKTPAVTTAMALASVPLTAAGLHAAGLANNVSIEDLSNGLLDRHMWMVVGFAALFGALGGVVAELLSLHGNVELPHRHGRRPRRIRPEDPRNEVDLGICSRMVLGAAAGVALLSIYMPDNATMLVANTLIAGSAATGLLRLVKLRLLNNSEAEKKPRPAATGQDAVPAVAVPPKPALKVVKPPQTIAQ